MHFSQPNIIGDALCAGDNLMLDVFDLALRDHEAVINNNKNAFPVHIIRIIFSSTNRRRVGFGGYALYHCFSCHGSADGWIDDGVVKSRA